MMKRQAETGLFRAGAFQALGIGSEPGGNSPNDVEIVQACLHSFSMPFWQPCCRLSF